MTDVHETVAYDGGWEEADAYIREMVADTYAHETAADGDDDWVVDGFVVVKSK